MIQCVIGDMMILLVHSCTLRYMLSFSSQIYCMPSWLSTHFVSAISRFWRQISSKFERAKARVFLTDRLDRTGAHRFRFTGPVTGRNRSNSNLNSKNSVQPVRTGIPAGLTGLNLKFKFNIACVTGLDRYTGRFDRFTGRFDRFTKWALMGRLIFFFFFFVLTLNVWKVC